MLFSVLSSQAQITFLNYPKAFLIRDNWDDWFEFSTLFLLIIVDEVGERQDLGGVKIGQFGMKTGQSSPQLPDEFDTLNESFFSLGQADSYYEHLRNLSSSLRENVLGGLKDLVADLTLFDRAIQERVTKISLLRFVTPVSVRGQFRRLLDGGARLSEYNFSYQAPSHGGSSASPLDLFFHVEPESNPPTNIHVLIGRNGVGKTRILNSMTCSLIDETVQPNQVGTFTSEETSNSAELFANLVSVTFSAFDDFKPLPEKPDKTVGIKYSYIGLKSSNNESEEFSSIPKTPEMLASEFVSSVCVCRQGDKATRWQKALEMLEADPIFREAEVAELANSIDEEAPETFNERAKKVFNKLSSGHKIVLLTMTSLVQTVEERTLVLLDEPEAHLHPPLLSAFIRALSDLLIYRNGVAIIATHSPVVLQEVPRSCAWKLRRTGYEATVERPEIETFGENVGVLTREIFGLEVTQSGFHRLLEVAVEEETNFDSAVGLFNNQLGSEARAILRALIAARSSEGEF